MTILELADHLKECQLSKEICVSVNNSEVSVEYQIHEIVYSEETDSYWIDILIPDKGETNIHDPHHDIK